MALQQTFVMIKPDAVQRRLIGEIISRFERKGLQLTAIKLVRVGEQLAKKHYEAHADRPFFPGLIKFITASPVVAMAWQGPDAIEVARRLLGPTDGRQAPPGTIRGDFGVDVGYNLAHASDSEAAAQRELALWFSPSELTDYDLAIGAWLQE